MIRHFITIFIFSLQFKFIEHRVQQMLILQDTEFVWVIHGHQIRLVWHRRCHLNIELVTLLTFNQLVQHLLAKFRFRPVIRMQFGEFIKVKNWFCQWSITLQPFTVLEHKSQEHFVQILNSKVDWRQLRPMDDIFVFYPKFPNRNIFIVSCVQVGFERQNCHIIISFFNRSVSLSK